MQVAGLAEAVAAHAELLPAGGAGGNLDIDLGSERGHGNLRTERGLPRRKFELVDEIVSVHLEVGMFREADAEIQIAAVFAAPGDAQLLALGDAGGNLDLMRVGAVLAAHCNGADGAALGLFERDENIALEVAALLGGGFFGKTSLPAKAIAAPLAAKH